MTQSETTYQSQVFLKVPYEMQELSARKVDLDRMSEGDPLVMSELYNTLADEFEAINYTIVAANCRKRAEYWREMRQPC